MPPKTELILSPFSPASPGILDHELPLVAKRRGPRDDQIVPCRVHSTSTIWHREDIERSHSIKRAVACFPNKFLEYILPLSSRKRTWYVHSALIQQKSTTIRTTILCHEWKAMNPVLHGSPRTLRASGQF